MEGINVKGIFLTTLLISVVTFLLYLFYGMAGINDGVSINEDNMTIVYDRENNTLIQLKPIYDGEDELALSNQTLHMMQFSTDANHVVNQLVSKNANQLQKSAVKILLYLPYVKGGLYEQYYDSAYFGYGVFGLKTAADMYFNKDVHDLSAEQMQWLLAVEAEYRENSSINLKRVTAFYKQAVSQFDLEYGAVSSERVNPEVYPYYDVMTALYKELEKLQLKEQDLYLQSYEIYTTVDRNVQQSISETIQNHNFQPYKTNDVEGVQAAMIIANNQNGEVLALNGGLNTKYFEPNRAVSLEKPPGSTFKPIINYAPALELGYDEQSILIDRPIDLNGYKPRNYDLKYRDTVTLKEAITHSYNLPAVRLLHEIGIQTGKEYAQRFGFQIEEKEDYRIALGYIRNGVSPAQMAQAYSTFENKGMMNDLHLIRDVMLEEQHFSSDVNTQRVISNESAEKMSALLRSVVEEGTANKLTLPHPTAGKTGTTASPIHPNLSEHMWFIGSTLNMTAAVWIGFDETPIEGGLTVSSGDGAVQLYEAVFQSIFR